MESLDVVVKAPRQFSFDMFDGTLYCYSSTGKRVMCVMCPYSGSVDCLSYRLKSFVKLCVEEEEVFTAVADVGKSSERDSETLHPDGPERSGVVNP